MNRSTPIITSLKFTENCFPSFGAILNCSYGIMLMCHKINGKEYTASRLRKPTATMKTLREGQIIKMSCQCNDVYAFETRYFRKRDELKKILSNNSANSIKTSIFAQYEWINNIWLWNCRIGFIQVSERIFYTKITTFPLHYFTLYCQNYISTKGNYSLITNKNIHR